MREKMLEVAGKLRERAEDMRRDARAYNSLLARRSKMDSAQVLTDVADTIEEVLSGH